LATGLNWQQQIRLFESDGLLHVETMIAGQRFYRNSLIMGVLRDYSYVDGRGMGVRIKVIPSMRSLNKTDPLFEATEDYVKTILPRKKTESE
jgi:ATP-dependent DNA helicase RecG